MDDLSRLGAHDRLIAHLELAEELIDQLHEDHRTRVRGEIQHARHQAETSRRKIETKVRASAAAAERLERKAAQR